MTDREILELLVKKIDNVENNLDNLTSDVNGLKSDVNDLKSDVNNIKDDVNDLKSDVKRIEMTLENVTNRNIEIIAEGHLNLSRKLDTALTHIASSNAEKELFTVRLTKLENEVNILKQKIGWWGWANNYVRQSCKTGDGSRMLKNRIFEEK